MTREQFYKSKQWESFRSVVINQRVDPDGYVHCCRCGKPILKKYDLILHHKKELTEDNVDDATIALNPDNVECMCFKCHNTEHDRWQGGNGGYVAPKKKVYIVYGAPCSGKTTWVHDNAGPDDLVVDMDSIWQMISTNARYVKPAALRAVVFQIRDKLLDIVKYRDGRWHTAYVITGGAYKGERERLQARTGADEFIFIDTDMSDCIDRCINRGMDEDSTRMWIQYIKEWFEEYQCD